MRTIVFSLALLCAHVAHATNASASNEDQNLQKRAEIAQKVHNFSGSVVHASNDFFMWANSCRKRNNFYYVLLNEFSHDEKITDIPLIRAFRKYETVQPRQKIFREEIPSENKIQDVIFNHCPQARNATVYFEFKGSRFIDDSESGASRHEDRNFLYKKIEDHFYDEETDDVRQESFYKERRADVFWPVYLNVFRSGENFSLASYNSRIPTETLDELKSLAKKESQAEIQAECQAAPVQDIWKVAGENSSLVPTQCQMMLAFEKAYREVTLAGSRALDSKTPDCNLLSEIGCRLKARTGIALIKLKGFSKGECTNDQICSYSAELTCEVGMDGRQANLISNAISCSMYGLQERTILHSVGKFQPTDNNTWSVVKSDETSPPRAPSPIAVQSACENVLYALQCPPR